MKTLLTVGDIARQLSVPQHKVNYAIEKEGILEQGRVGILRIFSQEQVLIIQAAIDNLRPMKARKPLTD